MTVTLKDGSTYTEDHFENTYWHAERNLYAIEYVESTTDIKNAGIEITSLDFPETVAWADNEFTFTVGFKSPIGLWQAEITICPAGRDCIYGDSLLLCNDLYWKEDGVYAIQLSHKGAKQVNGTFTEGKYQTKCVFEKDYNRPGDYNFNVELVNTARESTGYRAKQLSAMGIQSKVTLTP